MVKVQCFFYLSSNLVTYTFGRVFPSKCADLSRCFTQKLGDIGQSELSLSEDASEILQASV
ncbi:hypothetical protein [Pseudomonas sp. 31 E 6]|nr:hypothetical protein [Pseudomonas sp. 31 E 5]CRM24060.1 hypothetical protein [Pseudomonas sp. 31 E 6]